MTAHTQYRYQINIDGTVAAYRFPYLMAGGSLIFKQESGYYEHFYHRLEPWVHYVPLKNDLRDLAQRLAWVRENDDKAREMAANAVQFVQDHLLPEQLYCYIFQLLKVKLAEDRKEREGGRESEREKERSNGHPKSGAECMAE